MRVHEIFHQHAVRTPEAIALVDGDERVSYAELDARSNDVAAALQASGVRAGDRIGVRMSRSGRLIETVLGVLKAGGAYVPLALGDPPLRLGRAIADAGITVVACDPEEEAALVAHPVRTVVVDKRLTGHGSAVLPAGTGADLAYLMFTSGSTGRPKGVMVEHRGIVNLVSDPNFVSIGPGDTFLQLAAFPFDGATLEIWGPLLNGATLVVGPPDPVSVDEIRAVVRDHGVTVLRLTAALFHRQIDERIDTFEHVRVALAGGEVLSVPHVAALRVAVPGCQIINGYGPTEATQLTCCHRIGADEGLGSAVPIGLPLRNVAVHVLDEQGLPVPDGAPGELYIGGAGVARGYWGAPALTAAKFRPDPFAAEPGRRLYRTGDQVRRRPDGPVEFLGRLDDQVKLRGQRIEPGEVENVLGAFPSVQRVAVVVRRDQPAGDRLVAFIVPAGQIAVDRRALRRFARERLAAHLVPAEIVVLDALPITRNGKVDRKALREH